MRDLLNELKEGEPGPMRDPAHDRKPLPKRFYKLAETGEGENGFQVLLDGKPVRTPARRMLELPSEAAARLVAEEFAGQETHINPATMPVTRLANTTIDGVADDPQAVAEDIVKFASSDLLCYRAESPEKLVEREAEAWDPVLEWLRDGLGANFVLAEGVMPVAQPREAVTIFSARLKMHAEPFRIACIHTMTSLTGSAILALAVAEGHLSAYEAWRAAHVDEDWNIEQWGEDSEAAARRKAREREMMAAARLLVALEGYKT